MACTFDGKPVIYVFQAFLDSESQTLAGREILGFPKRHGEPELKTVREVLTGTLAYGGAQVALATTAVSRGRPLAPLGRHRAEE